MMHTSAFVHASGEARYLDDMPRADGELFAGLVLSTHTHAEISVDWTPALGLDSVWGYVSVEDVPGSNETGMQDDEEVFADGRVTHIGHIIGLVLAENRTLAQRAAKLVKVSYKDLPAIITIEVSVCPHHLPPSSCTSKCLSGCDS